MSQIESAAVTRPRWRFSFRLSTLFVVMTIAAIIFAWPGIYRQIQVQRFKTYAGRDLRKMSEPEQKGFDAIVASIIKPRELEFDENWRVWKFSAHGRVRYVLFQETGLRIVPSNAATRLKVFDNSGNLVSDTVVWAGWRIFAHDVELISDPHLDESLLVIHTGPTINGADIARQVYVLVNDQPELLRIEASDGELVPNAYAWPNHTIGSEGETRTEAQWVEMLTSKDNIAVLRALVWIGGHHHSRPVRDPAGIHIEDYDQAILHQKICSREDVVVRLRDLTSHKHPWIAEAAKRAIADLLTKD